MKSLAKRRRGPLPGAAAMRADIERYLAGQTVDRPDRLAAGAAWSAAIRRDQLPARPGRRRQSEAPPGLDLGAARARTAARARCGCLALVGGGDDGGDISVSDVVGMQKKAAIKAIQDEDLVAEAESVNSEERKGRVVDQDPDAESC